MAPIPTILVRIAATFLTQALTRRLQSSPLFFRMVDRMIHEVDHLPHRIQGKPVPQYRHIDPQEPTVREWAEEAWKRQVNDHGEPHDEPNPFASTSSRSNPPSSSDFSRNKDEVQRQRARDSFRAAQANANRARDSSKEGDESARREGKRDEMRELLEKLRKGEEK